MNRAISGTQPKIANVPPIDTMKSPAANNRD
jgi:hypothetical protein